MEAFQNRVIEEKDELDSKREKLGVFIDSEAFKALESGEQARLRRQFNIMADYSGILSERIANFK